MVAHHLGKRTKYLEPTSVAFIAVYIDTETAKKAVPAEDNKYPFEWCYPSPGGYPTSMCDAGETNLRSLMATIIVNQPNKKRKIRMLYGLIQEDGDKEAPRKGLPQFS